MYRALKHTSSYRFPVRFLVMAADTLVAPRQSKTLTRKCNHGPQYPVEVLGNGLYTESKAFEQTKRVKIVTS